MARFSGPLGIASTERTAGVSKEVITEFGPYYGRVTKASVALDRSSTVNTDIRTANVISIMSDDGRLSENAFAIRYAVWAGVAWSVAEVTIEHPRLLLRLGGVYRGTRGAAYQPPNPPTDDSESP